MKRFSFIFLCVLLTVLVASCGRDKSTPLSGITLDGVQVGSAFKDIEIEKYTISDRYSESEGFVSFEEWSITCNDENLITKIHANMIHIEVMIDNNAAFSTVDDVISTLGKNYSSDWHDQEQQLRQIVYTDYDNHIQAVFVYNDSRQLVWVILEYIG